MGLSFDSILGAFTGGGKGESVVGIDIGSSSIKMVQLRLAKGSAILETYGEIALGPYHETPIGKAVKLPPEKLAEAVTDLMREASVTAKKGGMAIPFSSSLLTVLNLPKVDNEQLKRIVPMEARKYIPIPISEVALDWFVIPKNENAQGPFDDTTKQKESVNTKTQEILLVAIHNDIVHTYQQIATSSNLATSFFEIEIFSAIRSSIGSGIAPILFVDIGASTTKIYIVERGVVRLTHLLTLGGQQITETLAHAMNWEFEKAERIKRERGLLDSNSYSLEENQRIKEALLYSMTRVFSEVNRVLLSFGQRYNKNIAHICFSGGGASLPGLLDIAKEALATEVLVASPFDKTESPAFMGTMLKEIGPGFAVAVGLALRALNRG